jgi:hypothetical protein
MICSLSSVAVVGFDSFEARETTHFSSTDGTNEISKRLITPDAH